MIEPKRGCGFRTVGGLYLVGEGLWGTCDRLPYPVIVCPTCGEGIRPSRGIRWMDGATFFGGNCPQLAGEIFLSDKPETPTAARFECHLMHCPICFSDELGKVGLMWVGERFYPTPRSFELEAEKLGVSKRIAAVPKEIELGKTWILLVHPKAIVKTRSITGERVMEEEPTSWRPGIFHAFKASRIEKIVTDQTSDEEIEKFKKRGITPVVVPYDDPDHNPGLKKKQAAMPELAMTSG